LIVHLAIRPLLARLALLEMIWYDIFPTPSVASFDVTVVCGCHVRRGILQESAYALQLPPSILLQFEHGN
jgi:hypothetical protein